MGNQIEAGTVLFNRFKIESVVGKGGLGAVYQAFDSRLRRYVAIKTIVYGHSTLNQRYGSGTFEEYVSRFEREAEVSGYFTDNSQIITVYDLIQDGDSHYYLILEYLEGGALTELIKSEGHLSVRRSCEIALDICGGLADIHNHVTDIVHRDLKPGNILLRGNGRAVVADFGIAQVGHESHRTVTSNQRHPGTPAYMSPEQVSVYHYLTPASDLYSLGLLIYEMLTGRLYAKVRRLPPSELDKAIPDWLDEIVLKLLQKEPEDRYQQAEEVAEAIQAGMALLPPVPKEEIESIKERRRQTRILDKPTPPEKPSNPPPLRATDQLSPTRPLQEVEAERQRKAQQEVEIQLKDQLAREVEASRQQQVKLIQHERYERAIADINLSIQLEPHKADHYYRRGKNYVWKGEYAQAIADFNQALQLAPGRAHYYFERSLCYLFRHESEPAIADFDRAIALDPNKAEYYYFRGTSYYNNSNYEQAINDLSRAIKLDMNKAKYFWQRGLCYHQQRLKNRKGEYDWAIEDFSRAIKLEPNRAEFYGSRGKSFHSKNEYQQAIADFTQAIQLSPTKAEFYFERGKSYYWMDDDQRAIDDLSRAIRLDATKSEYYWLRGVSYHNQGDYERATADMNRVSQLNESNAAYCFERGVNLFNQGHYESALADLNRAIQLEPRNSQYFYQRGLIYKATSDKPSAQQDFQHALELGFAKAKDELE